MLVGDIYFLSSCFFSEAASEVASFAAVARSPMDALPSLATCLLASLEVPEMPCWTVSDAEVAAFLMASMLFDLVGWLVVWFVWLIVM